MNNRHYLTLVAGTSAFLSALPLTTVFRSWTWLFYSAFALFAVSASAALVRSRRGPVWAQGIAMVAALAIVLTMLFPSGHELFRLLPTPDTFYNFADLLRQAATQIQQESIPVPDRTGLLMLTTLGVGAVGLAIDLIAVGLRRPAMAGLPMLAVYSVPVAVLPDGLSFFPFILGASGYLWLLAADRVELVRGFGRRFNSEGRNVDPWEPSPLAAAGRRLGVIGMAIALLVPLILPGPSAGLLERLSSGAGGGYGNGKGPADPSATVNLDAILQDNLTRNETFNMVRVTTNDPNPFYLRFGVADEVRSDGFHNRTPAGATNLNSGLGALSPPSGPGVTTSTYHASVETINFDMRLAPVYLQPTKVDGLDSNWYLDPSTTQIYSRKDSTGQRTYSFDFDHVFYTPDGLRTAGPITDPHLRALASVPRVKTVDQLVASLTAGKNTEYDKIRALYDYFQPSNGFLYSLSVPRGNSSNPIVNFLTVKKGFCVQYAAALAWMVRSAGYPARVAFGFTRGTGQGRSTTLTNNNLHAWTEVYFTGFGWVPFDATPADSVAGSAPSPWAPDPTGVVPDQGPGEDIQGHGQSTASPDASAGAASPGDKPGGGIPGIADLPVPPWAGYAVLVALLLVGLLILPALRRRTIRRRRLAASASTQVIDLGIGTLDRKHPASANLAPMTEPEIARVRQSAHAVWQEMIDTMIDFAVPVDPTETPRATARRLSRLLLAREARGAAEALAGSEERARYARTPMPAEGLGQAIRTLREAMADAATRRQRIVAVILPPSVLLRWRLATSTVVSEVIVVTGRWRDRLFGTINPRRLLAGRSSR